MRPRSRRTRVMSVPEPQLPSSRASTSIWPSGNEGIGALIAVFFSRHPTPCIARSDLACFLRIPSTSLGCRTTSYLHDPNPPCALTAFTHSSKKLPLGLVLLGVLALRLEHEGGRRRSAG